MIGQKFFVTFCRLPDPPELSGPYEPNDILKYAERLYSGKLQGPESIVVDGGELSYKIRLSASF